MKKITFEISVPNWARWKSTDMNGKVWVWSHKPIYSCGYWVTARGVVRNAECIMQLTNEVHNAHETLVEIGYGF